MKKQKNSSRVIKLFTVAFFVLMSACSDCGFSERCHREKEKARILNMTDHERESKKNLCVKDYERMISVTNHEKRQCNFWSCVDGKEDLRKRLNSCLWRLENIKNQ